MNNHKCEFCGNTFSTKSNLNKHKKTSKKCLEIQEESNDNIIKVTYTCSFCNKEYTSNYKLKNHLKKCGSLDNESVHILMNKVKELEKKVEQKTTIINNNQTINNTNIIINNNINFLEFMSGERIKQVFDRYYSTQTLLGSEESLARFTIDNFLSGKDRPIYICADKKLKKFYFFDDEGKRIDDSNAQLLLGLIIQYGFDSITDTYSKSEQNDELNTIYNNLLKLKNTTSGKKYINGLANGLPQSVDERQVRDKMLCDSESKVHNSSTNDVEEDNFEIEYDSDYDIGGIPFKTLQKYRKHYIDTKQIVMPKELAVSQEFKNEFRTFISS